MFKKITKDMSVSRIIAASPAARGVMSKHGIKFIGKDLSPLESLETVAKGNGLGDGEIRQIISEINSAKEERGGNLIALTGPASEKLKEMIDSKKAKGIRLRLVSDGCATYTYDMDFGTKAVGDEIRFNSGNVTFFIEKKSVDFLKGTTIDYRPDEDGFVFSNPNVKGDKSV